MSKRNVTTQKRKARRLQLQGRYGRAMLLCRYDIGAVRHGVVQMLCGAVLHRCSAGGTLGEKLSAGGAEGDLPQHRASRR